MSAPAERTAPAGFHRHRMLRYQGHAFPWYVLVMWVIFLTSGVAYLFYYIAKP